MPLVDYALYPGCLVSNRYPHLELAVRKIAETLGVSLEDMQGTSCCPEPQGIQSTDKRTWMTLAARNIAIAEEMGKDILTLCNGCFETLKSVNVRLKRHPELMEDVNQTLAAIDKEYNHIFEMDADLSHDPKEIPNFLERIKDYDLVIGSRYIKGINVINWPLRRLILSYGANIYTRVITGLPLKDSTGGFKCFRRKVLENIDLDKIHSEGYAFQIEVNYKTWKKGFKITEIPIIFVDRTEGKSKMSKKIVREAIWIVWKLRLLSIINKL